MLAVMGSSSINSRQLSIVTALRSAVSAATDLVYPPVCLGCGILVGSHGGLCPECWRRLSAIDKPYCATLGKPLPYDAGEEAVSPEAIADPPPFQCARAAVVYTDLARILVHRLKYNDRTDLALAMSRWMKRAGGELVEASDLLVSIPLHRRRLVARRYNQAAELARALAGQTGLPYLPAALVRKRPTRSQVGLSKAARLDNVRGAFVVPDRSVVSLAGRRVLLVDDVYTTGATIKAATRTLLQSGVEAVSVLTFARVAPDQAETLYDGAETGTNGGGGEGKWPT